MHPLRLAAAGRGTIQMLVALDGAKNMAWEGVSFQYATWAGASGPKGFVDTQSAYLYQEGEPPVNVQLHHCTNISFTSCSFEHLGAVYAIGANEASQSVAVSNCTFTDVSGGGVKLGSVGERGDPAPVATLAPALQDRGFLVSDNLFQGIPVEYSGANPVFAGCVARCYAGRPAGQRSAPGAWRAELTRHQTACGRRRLQLCGRHHDRAQHH